MRLIGVANAFNNRPLEAGYRAGRSPMRSNSSCTLRDWSLVRCVTAMRTLCGIYAQIGPAMRNRALTVRIAVRIRIRAA
jgi:hypothetical protein